LAGLIQWGKVSYTVATHEEPYSERQRHEVIRLKIVTRIRRTWLTSPSNFRLVLLSPLKPPSDHRINEWQLHKIAERREDVNGFNVQRRVSITSLRSRCYFRFFWLANP